MHVTDVPSAQFQSSFRCFAKFLVGLHKLPIFNAVSLAEEEAHAHIGDGAEGMDTGERQIVILMQQLAEVYARDRQMQITGRNPFEVIIEMDEAKTRCSTSSQFVINSKI